MEVLTADGRKLKGTLTEATDEQITLDIPTKVQVEGKKRPVLQDVPNTLPMAEVKQGRYLIDFK